MIVTVAKSLVVTIQIRELIANDIAKSVGVRIERSGFVGVFVFRGVSVLTRNSQESAETIRNTIIRYFERNPVRSEANHDSN
jgi:hypothetical protein